MTREEQLKQAIDESSKSFPLRFAVNKKTFELYADKVLSTPSILRHADPEIMKQAGWVREEELVKLVQSLKDYTRESQSILGFDDRDASEFVEIYFKKPQP